MRFLFLTIFLCGCATQDPGRGLLSTHQELALVDLVKVCNHGTREHEDDLNGCFEWIGGICHIYTLPRWVREQRDGDLSGYHRTLGHELDHCARGYFHGGDKGVPLVRLPRLLLY